MDTDFFQLCKYHKVKENIEILGRYIQREYSIDILKSPYPRMEEIFGTVYSDTRLKPPSIRAREAYTALCRVYKRVLLETTNPLSPTPRGPLAKLIRFVSDRGESSIITFNQDLLIEKALISIDKRNPIWFPDTGYTTDFSIYTVPPSDKVPRLDLSEGIDSKIKIMKLHGSLNWYTLTRSETQIPSTMPKSTSVKCSRNISIPPELTYVSRGRGRTNWYTWPVIVPPVFEKGAFLNETLSPIWNAAKNEVETANEILVFGYSFPQSDQQARSFFRRARASNEKLRKLVVINPDTNAAVVANEIFSPPVLISTRDVKSYVKAFP